MIVIILSIVGLVLFVAGISFIFKGYSALPKQDAVTPRLEYERLKNEFLSVQESEKRTQRDLKMSRLELEAVRESFDMTRREEEGLRAEFEKLKSYSEEFKNANETQMAPLIAQIEDLKQKNSLLKADEENYKIQIAQFEETMAGLKQKTIGQAEGSLELINHLQAEVVSLKEGKDSSQPQLQKLQDELAEAKKTLDGLKEELAEAKKTIEKSNAEIDSLKAKENGTAQDSKLKMANAQLLEREKAAQYELAKTKAQVAGLEKICADFKAKFENIEELEEELRKAKNRLAVLEEENNVLKKG